jgi:hypothetical protein
MAGEVCRAPDRGQARRAAHQEVVERRRVRGWEANISRDRDAAGGSISPLLANIYLHYVFDLWTQQWRKREARGDVIVVRYVDDIVATIPVPG